MDVVFTAFRCRGHPKVPVNLKFEGYLPCSRGSVATPAAVAPACSLDDGEGAVAL
jgi:hypothetical protein